MPEEKIVVAREGDVALVRIAGRATFKISRNLREFGMMAVREGCAAFIVDLEQCTAMDSTVMGVFAMIGLEGRSSTDLIIINATELHRRLLDGIGLGKIWRYAARPTTNATWRDLTEATAATTEMADVAPTVLAAHRALMQLKPENVPVFRDVVDMLSAEMDENPDSKKNRK